MGTRIPDDHYGAGFFYYFGDEDSPVVQKHFEAYRARMPKRDPRATFVAGGKEAIMARIQEYVDGDVTKFVLRPIGADDEDLMRQTRLMVEELLPAIDELNARNRMLGAA